VPSWVPLITFVGTRCLRFVGNRICLCVDMDRTRTCLVPYPQYYGTEMLPLLHFRGSCFIKIGHVAGSVRGLLT
jgi:hypothetical protein